MKNIQVGLPSPDPSFPQPILSAGDNVNLFDKSTVTQNYRMGSDGTYFPDSNYFLTDYIAVKPNTMYTGNTPFVNAYNRIAFYDANKSYIGKNDGGDNYFITTITNAKYIKFAKAKVQLDTFKLVEGTNVGEWSPYGMGCVTEKFENEDATEIQTFIIPCQQPMRRINKGNFQKKDLFFKNIPDSKYYDSNLVENMWYERHEIGHYDFTGEENWLTASSIAEGTTMFYISLAGVKNQQGGYGYVFSNRFIPISWLNMYSGDTTTKNAISNYNQYNTSAERIVIRIDNNIATTKEQLNTFLSNNPTYAEYELTEPLLLPCTSEQIEVLEEFVKARTYKNVTHIFSEDTTPAYIDLVYYKDLENTVNNTIEDLENYTDDAVGIDISKIELLLPDKFYLIDEEPLRLYKTSFVQEYKDFQKFRLSLSSQFDFNTSVKSPFNKFIDSVLDINSDEINDKITIKLMDDYDITTMYGKEIDVEKCNVADKLSSTPKINMFGDSTTANGLVYAVKSNLSELGFEPIMIGTVGQPSYSEARAGYTYAEYIGYRTIQTNESTQTPLLPFLKLATSTDKTNHPDWCFTRTAGGSSHEKTYAEVVNEGGDTSQDFYIFDYDYYINNNDLETPNIVTFGMGINDAWKYGTEGMLTIANKALTIMINQIHTFNSNINIGIIPFPVSSNIKEYHPQWLYDCLQLATQLNTQFNSNKIKVIAESLSQSKEMDFNYTETSIENTQVKKFTVGDRTHTKLWGYREGSKPITYYIINQL